MTMRMTIPRLRLVTAFAIVAAISIFGLFAHNGPLSVSAQADTTAPTFVSATTSRDGIEVMVTFSEDIAVSPLVSTLAEKYGVTQGMILKDLMTVTVDGRDNVLISSSYSGPVLTLRLENPQARTGQVVKVAYNNIFAQEPGGVLTDSAYNAVELFDFQSVTNASVDDSASTFIDQPVLDKSTLTLCEGQDGTYGVSLPSQPTGNVGIGTLFTPWDIVYPSPEYLSFTQDNWDTDQTITILTDVDDDDYTNWAMVYNRISGVDVTQTYDKVIRVLVLEENHADCSQVGQQTEAENTPATGAPAITGTPQPGEVLTADTSGMSDADGMEGATFTYQWVRNDGSTDTGITGATGSTYTVVEDDVGNEIKVRVSFTDDGGSDETVTSAAAYVQSPQPLYGGFDEDTVPESHDGATAFTFQIHFSEPPILGWRTVRDHVLGVTNGNVSRARRTTSGSNIRWEITLAPGGNGDVTVALPATTDCAGDGAVCTQGGKMLSNRTSITVPGPVKDQQRERTPPPPAPTALTGAVNSDGSITINWTAPNDNTVTGYQILRRRPQQGENSLLVYVNDTGSTATSYTDTYTSAKTRYVYRVKARNSAGVGARSNYVTIDK